MLEGDQIMCSDITIVHKMNKAMFDQNEEWVVYFFVSIATCLLIIL